MDRLAVAGLLCLGQFSVGIGSHGRGSLRPRGLGFERVSHLVQLGA